MPPHPLTHRATLQNCSRLGYGYASSIVAGCGGGNGRHGDEHRRAMTARAVLSPISLSVDPGAEATAVVTIRNTGAVVDHFHVQVLGDAARWATATPETLPLFPDAEGQVTISFRPARVSAARAGSTPFGVKVTSEVDPSDSSVEEGTLEIGAFTELTGELVPVISHGSRTGRHQLACDNRGNIPLTLAFGGVDPEEALRFA